MDDLADTSERVDAIRERLAELAAELEELRDELDDLLTAKLSDFGEAERQASRVH